MHCLLSAPALGRLLSGGAAAGDCAACSGQRRVAVAAVHGVDVVDCLGRQADAEGLQVLFELLHAGGADDGAAHKPARPVWVAAVTSGTAASAVRARHRFNATAQRGRSSRGGTRAAECALASAPRAARSTTHLHHASASCAGVRPCFCATCMYSSHATHAVQGAAHASGKTAAAGRQVGRGGSRSMMLAGSRSITPQRSNSRPS